jgi:hypothetical protein
MTSDVDVALHVLLAAPSLTPKQCNALRENLDIVESRNRTIEFIARVEKESTSLSVAMLTLSE